MLMKEIIFLDVLSFFCKTVLHIENFISVKIERIERVKT